MQTNYISYKDSAARVFLKDGNYYRYIFNEYKSEYDHLMDSGLYKELNEKGLLISHEEISVEDQQVDEPTNLYKLIKPNQLQFQSYPFEWSYTQWRKAIVSYLEINMIALRFGKILKDGTPYNFYLSAGKAMMIDTSSFSFFKDGDKWIAYKQFCSEFLSPLALIYYNGQRWLRINRSHLRGLPLNFASRQLPLKSWFNLTTLLHTHLHSKYANAEGLTNRQKQNKSRGFSVDKLKALTAMILSGVNGWKTAFQFERHWSTYYENDIEANLYLENKERIIKEWLQKTQPSLVLDLGADTGKFSFIAKEYAYRVIAIESDDICVDIIEKEILHNNIKYIDVLTTDLADATPDFGVLNKEFASIYNRAGAQMVMALAIIHHLHISDQLSFNQIAEIFSKLSRDNLIVEFIPIDDSKVQLLTKEKTKNFIDYTEANFIRALSKYFHNIDSYRIEDSGRKLFLMEKRS